MCELNLNYPPILDGRFDVESVTFGYVPKKNGVGINEYNLDNPIVGKYQSVFTYKNEYISVYNDFIYTGKNTTKKYYGVWRKKLGPNLEFNGWECVYTYTPQEKNVFVLDPIKINNNKVEEYVVYLLNVGTNTNIRSNETSFICKLTGKKI